MSKIVYNFNGKDDFAIAEVSDDYTLQANETFDDPGNVLLPVTFTGGKIVGATMEAHEAYQAENTTVPDGANTPSAEMQAINALGLQVATLMADKAANTTGGAN